MENVNINLAKDKDPKEAIEVVNGQSPVADGNSSSQNSLSTENN